MKKLAAAFPASLDAVVVADNPEGPGGSAFACAAILAAENREPVLSIITRDRDALDETMDPEQARQVARTITFVGPGKGIDRVQVTSFRGQKENCCRTR